MSRYGGWAAFDEYELDDIQHIVDYAVKSAMDEKAYNTWLSGGYNIVMSFADFKRKLTPDKRTEKEILSEVEHILDSTKFEQKQGDGFSGARSI